MALASEQSKSDSTKVKPVRWWLLWFILAAAGLSLLWVWTLYDRSRQDRYIATVQVVFFGIILVVVWAVFLSRLRKAVRWSVLGVVLGAIILGGSLFRIRGVTGDLLPVLEWRWKKEVVMAKPEASTNLLVASASQTKVTNSYPQFLGPDRTGVLPGPKLVTDWKASAPEQLWKQAIGTAWSGFAVFGNFAVTQEQRGEEELVVCYETLSGKVLWSHADKARYFTTIAGEGPRATPTISSNRVYTVGATGLLNCLDLTTGAWIWSTNFVEGNASDVPDWGVSCSPLVTEKYVVVNAGGRANRTLVAYERETGKFAWGGGNESMDYSSPQMLTLAGVRQILSFNPESVTSHDPERGTILWQHPWPRGNPHVSVPIRLPDDQVLISAGYGVGSELVKISKDSEWRAMRIWKTNRLKSKFANLIYLDGYIYGVDDGILACIDAKDGSLKWKDGRYGHGQMILVEKIILLMAEQGNVVLLDPNPTERRELASLKVFEDKTWNPPTLAGEYLLIRNDKEAACFRLPVSK